MSERHSQDEREDDSPVGDVRRIRKQLSARFGNDVRKLGEYARRVGERTGCELGCSIVRKPSEPAGKADQG